MKKTIVCLIMVLSSLQAFANATGSWIGWLYWSFDGSAVRCDSTMKYRQTQNSFERFGAQVVCDFVSMQMDARKWSLQNGKVFDGTQEVGSYNENQIQWREEYSETVFILSEMTVSGRHLDYTERWMRKRDHQEIYHIKGRLFLRDNK